MARFAIQHKPTERFLMEEEVGTAFLAANDDYIMTYKTRDMAERAIDEHFKVYYTTINNDDDFEIEDGTFSFKEFTIVKV
tara:strand:+ start:37 stop:276 length:240 start_codon:yes stop_codon:yes gene_type:complete